MAEQTSWIIGSDPACDLVVDRPSVSWRHCRLAWRGEGLFTVEDLGSTNGTFVNGRQVRGAVAVRRGDQVTLGQTVPMPWPPEPSPAAPDEAPGARVFRVGRDPGNDVVIDSPEVSARHARVLIAPGGREGIVEDLGSTNGTSVGAPGSPVPRATIRPGDVVYFGPVAYPAATFFPADSVERRESIPDLVFRGPVMTVGRDPDCDRVVDFPVVSSRHARIVRAGGALLVEDLGSSNGTYVNGRRVVKTAPAKPGDMIGLGSCTLRLVDPSADLAPEGEPTVNYGPDSLPTRVPPIPIELDADQARAQSAAVAGRAGAGAALGAQAGLLAEAVVLAAGRSETSALFGLALAAVWFGLTSALFERLLDAATAPGARVRRPVAVDLAWSLGRSAVFDLALCAVLLGITFARVPFDGRWPVAFAVLWLTALIGSALGLALARVLGRLVYALAAAVALVGLLASLGGPNRPLPGLNPVARLAAGALPTRWAFESLLLAWAGDRAEDPVADPVEPFFPAETDRAGPLTCAWALLAMLGGVVYLDGLIALSQADRPPRTGSGLT
jgi:pSer/pThr/pTyr-binding forkhead associated (FHA) protein